MSDEFVCQSCEKIIEPEGDLQPVTVCTDCYEITRKQLEMAKDVMKVCRDAISSLPIDALGEGEKDYNGYPYKYPIRDEVIDTINKALAEIERIGVEK